MSNNNGAYHPLEVTRLDDCRIQLVNFSPRMMWTEQSSGRRRFDCWGRVDTPHVVTVEEWASMKKAMAEWTEADKKDLVHPGRLKTCEWWYKFDKQPKPPRDEAEHFIIELGFGDTTRGQEKFEPVPWFLNREDWFELKSALETFPL